MDSLLPQQFDQKERTSTLFNSEILGANLNGKAIGVTNQNCGLKRAKNKLVSKTKMMEPFGWHLTISNLTLAEFKYVSFITITNSLTKR